MGGLLRIVGSVAGVGGMMAHLTASVAREVLRAAEVHAPGTGRFVRRSAGLAAAPVRLGGRMATETVTRPVVAAFSAVDFLSRRLGKTFRPRMPILLPLVGAALLAGILSKPEEVVS